MKTRLVFLILGFSISSSVVAQNYFQNIYADSTWEESTMAASPDAYYLIQLGGAPNFDAKLMKVDLSGNLLWSKKYTASAQGFTSLMQIAYSNNALLVSCAYQNAGYFNGLAKLDTSGNVLWSKQFAYGDINQNTRIIPLTTGYLLCGHRDYEQAGIFTFDITLTRIDDSGNIVWAKAFGNNSFDFTCAAAVLSANNELIVAGNYGLRMPPDYDPMIARFDSSGNLLWMKTFNDASGFFVEFTPTDMCVTSDGNFAITGFTKNTNSNFDPQLIKIDGGGNILWAKRLYQIGWQEYGNSIICDSQSNIVIAGSYFLNYDYGDFFTKFDLAGNFIGSTKISNTSKLQGIWFNDIYHTRGGDLYERTGYGYAYSTSFDFASNYSAQCLITGDYLGNLNCTALGGSYPFTVANSTWTITNLASLPTAQTNISAATGNMSGVVITESQTDICSLVSVNESGAPETLTIFPNPAGDELSIEGNDLKGTLRILDLSGRMVYYDEIKTGDSLLRINASFLNQGLYRIELHTAKGSFFSKFVKQ